MRRALVLLALPLLSLGVASPAAAAEGVDLAAPSNCATRLVFSETATILASSPITGTPPGSFGVRVPAAGPLVSGTTTNATAFVVCFV